MGRAGWARVWCLVAAWAAAGCMSTATQTARTNGRGHLRVAVEPGAEVVGFGEEQSVLPDVDVSATYGVTDRLDVGARLGPGALELQTKWMLTDREVEGAWALAPSLTVSFADALGLGPFFGVLHAPLLRDVPLGDHTLVLGARASGVVAPGEAGGVNQGWQVSAGVSVGLEWVVAPWLRVHPEVGLDAPLLGEATALPGARAPRLGLRVGLVFGSRGGAR